MEIFLTKEELNKVCSACGKTLEEHGIVKYDHSNSMGDQHSMYNQNSGRETWVGQGLPQPTVEGKDDHPAEQGLTINGDARQNSGKKKGRTARNRKRRQAKQIKEGMSMFDTPNEVDNIMSEAQAEADASREAARMEAYEPYERLGYLGTGITGMLGGYPGQYQSQITPNPTPLQTALGTGAVLSGIYGNMQGNWSNPYQYTG